MFRNPRENAARKPTDKLTPAVGRPPSPPRVSGVSGNPSTQATSRDLPAPRDQQSHGTTARDTTMSARTKTITSTRTPNAAKATTKLGAVGGMGMVGKKTNKSKPNGSILSFFKRADGPPGGDEGLFLLDNGRVSATKNLDDKRFEEDDLYGNGDDFGSHNDIERTDEGESDDRFNEEGGSVKRRKTSSAQQTQPSPSPDNKPNKNPAPDGTNPGLEEVPKASKRTGPFADDSDSDVEMQPSIRRRAPIISAANAGAQKTDENVAEDITSAMDLDTPDQQHPILHEPPTLRREETSFADGVDLEDYEDEFAGGEEFEERMFMKEQRRLELAENGMLDEDEDIDDGPTGESINKNDENGLPEQQDSSGPTCPICNTSLAGVSDQQASVHVNSCLDGNPMEPSVPEKVDTAAIPAKGFARQIVRPAKPGQQNPFTLDGGKSKQSAFSKLMSGHAEDAAWASAAAEETAARGKPAYQRTCPFYKILPGFSICVDAFRYGAVEGCKAYFLSHFHSDHYIGLTATWRHGPIYCSRVTGNLVRQQLRVDPQFVVDLEFEETREVPGTDGVKVTMIPANHCPGSSLFLFEKALGRGKNPRQRRVLHCGDFRACRAHIEHPLLRPDVQDAITGKNKEQKIDVCYLDTTYLNPRYAFPSQDDVMQACAERCVSFANEPVGKEQLGDLNTGGAAAGMAKFVRTESDRVVKDTKPSDAGQASQRQGGLLVVVGTYSIGKERICMAVARALNSKIYATAAKHRICACLEDPELNALLTTDPLAAQVHMTPLGEIRPETLRDYLATFGDRFDRAVAFRPSGWNYRPPVNRAIEAVTVPTVLRNAGSWRSPYSARDLVPQRGSTARVRCFGVPYSEHSSFRELTLFCCSLRIDKIIPTVNVGSAKSRERMKAWADKWAVERKKNGVFRPGENEW